MITVYANFFLTAPLLRSMIASMSLLTEEEIERVWEEQGLKHHVKRLYLFLRTHGLLPMSVRDYAFADAIKRKILINFFVKGVKEDEHGRQSFPVEPDRRSEEESTRTGSSSGDAPRGSTSSTAAVPAGSDGRSTRT